MYWHKQSLNLLVDLPRMFQRTTLLFLLCGVLLSVYGSQVQGKGVLLKREADDHGHEDEDEHGHEEEGAASAQCAVTEHILEHEFNELAEELSLTGPDGALCVIEEDHHDDEGNETDHHDDEMDHHGDEPLNLTCESTFEFFERLLLRLNLTTDCCLENGTACEEPTEEAPTAGRTRVAEAYGYGFLMILAVSACPLVGLSFVPVLTNKNSNPKCGMLYKYFISLMIALGASALFCDAILHLIPEAFGLHNHGPVEDAHAHEEEEDQTFIWKGVVVIAGTYLFFIFETILHVLNPHNHSHKLVSEETGEEESNGGEDSKMLNGTASQSAGQEIGNICLEPTIPHGQCRDGKSSSIPAAGILHPTELDGGKGTSDETPPPKNKNLCVRFYHYIKNIKPLAWLIIFGDGLHNFVDGLALAAAISQSLSLGLSTMIALILHEIPHELGDYAILISTGMSWYVALLFNLLSALTAVLGFFVGVPISTNSEEASSWILAIAAGVFIYIALVDLLPELIHSKEKGCTRWLMFLMANIGFIISFVALLLIAVYEEQLNSIVS